MMTSLPSSMTADSDADDASTANIACLALEAGSNLIYLGWMTRLSFSGFSSFAALLRLPPSFNGCALLARRRAAVIAPAFCALLFKSV